MDEAVMPLALPEILEADDIASANSTDSTGTIVPRCIEIVLESIRERKDVFDNFIKDLATMRIISEEEVSEISSLMQDSSDEVCNTLCKHMRNCAPDNWESLVKEGSVTAYHSEAKILHALLKKEFPQCVASLIQSLEAMNDDKSDLMQILIKHCPYLKIDCSWHGWRMDFIVKVLMNVEVSKSVESAFEELLRVTAEKENPSSDLGTRKIALKITSLKFFVVTTEIIEQGKEPDFSVELWRHYPYTSEGHGSDKLMRVMVLTWKSDRGYFFGEHEVQNQTGSCIFEYFYIIERHSRSQRLKNRDRHVLFEGDTDILDVIGVEASDQLKSYEPQELAGARLLPMGSELGKRGLREKIRKWIKAMEKQTDFQMHQALGHWIITAVASANSISTKHIAVVCLLKEMDNVSNAANKTLLDEICRCLMLPTEKDWVFCQDLERMRSSILEECEMTRSEMVETLVSIFKAAEKIPFLNWILVLPLYWIFASEPRSAIPDKKSCCKTVPGDKGIDWAEVTMKAAEAKEDDFEDLYYKVKNLAEDHLWLYDVFCIVTPNSLALLLLKKHTNRKLRIAYFKCLFKRKKFGDAKPDSTTTPEMEERMKELKETIAKPEKTLDEEEDIAKECLSCAKFLLEATNESEGFDRLHSNLGVTEHMAALHFCLRMQSTRPYGEKFCDTLEKTEQILQDILSNLARKPISKPDESWLKYCDALLKKKWPSEEISTRFRDYFHEVYNKFWNNAESGFIDLFAKAFPASVMCSDLVKNQLARGLSIALKGGLGLSSLETFRNWAKSSQIKKMLFELLIGELNTKSIPSVLQSFILMAVRQADTASLKTYLQQQNTDLVEHIKKKIDNFLESIENNEISMSDFKLTSSCNNLIDLLRFLGIYLGHGNPVELETLVKRSNTITLNYDHFALVSAKFMQEYNLPIEEMELLDAENQPIKLIESWLKDHENDLIEYELGIKLKKNQLIKHATQDIGHQNAIDWWKSVKGEAGVLLRKILNGNILIGTLSDIFHDMQFVQENLDGLKEHFLDLKDTNVDELCAQILAACNIQKNSKLLLLLNEATGSNNILLQKLQKLQDFKLNQVDGVIFKLGQKLAGISEEMTEYLQAFIEQKTLRKWLQDEIKDLDQLMILMDLIMSNDAGNWEDDISKLLSAVRGFAPIIYGVRTDADYAIDAIGKLDNNIKANDFKSHWVESGERVDRYKKLSATYAGGEVKYREFMTKINSHGHYRLGYPKLGEDVALPVASDCIILEISPTLLQGDEKGVWTLRELQYYQEKLLLMTFSAEKMEESTKNFTALLNAVDSIAQELVKIVNLGCLLFRDWTCEIKPSLVAGLWEVVMMFNSECPAVKEKLSTEALLKLARELGRIAQRQKLYLQRARERHYFLNEYAIEQCKFLCAELPASKTGKSENLSKIQDLLSLVLKCTNASAAQQQINECLENAMVSSESERSSMIAQYSDILPGKSGVTKRERDVIDKLVKKKRLQRNVATAAVQAVGSNRIDECFDWATNHRRDVSKIANLCRQFREKDGFKEYDAHDSTRSTLAETIKNALQSHDQLPIFESVQSAANRYYQNTITMTLRDYLSMEHLGKFLTLLREKCCLPEQTIQRKLVDPLKTGVPNLIVCPSNEVLLTALSLYMTDESQPLPSYSEVLLCSETTRQDEVERFVQKALLKNPINGRPLHCLAFAEKLSLQNQRAIETMYCYLSKQKDKLNSSYQLVVISSLEKSYLASCFRKHKVSWHHNKYSSNCKRYLADKLRVDPNILSITSPDHRESTTGGELTQSSVDIEQTNTPTKIVTMIDGCENSTVRIITSQKPGQGKSLCVSRMQEGLHKVAEEEFNRVTVRCIENEINVDELVKKLISRLVATGTSPQLVHVDISSAVKKNLDQFLFNLFVLGKIEHSLGSVWLRKQHHIYAIEILEQQTEDVFHISHLLPNTNCISPREAFDLANAPNTPTENGYWDKKEFQNEVYQRPCAYLQRFKRNPNELDDFNYPTLSSFHEFLSTLLDSCDIPDPTWAQLRYFCSYLNYQLKNYENSDFCIKEMKKDMPGLKHFAIKHLIATAKDVSITAMQEYGTELEKHKFNRYWDNLKSPLFFFNDDGHTMTFINIKWWNIDVTLYMALENNSCFEHNDLDDKPDRPTRLTLLRRLMNLSGDSDPDPQFELTTDNVLKIMAIHVRLRCGIPLVVMGETGCGKTRMIEFMSKLKAGKNKVANMETMRIHGGVTKESFYEDVRNYACDNARPQDFVLFFDEANTTLAAHAIKEVMCDRTIDGIPFNNPHLHFVAACNPYKEMTAKEITKLKKCGLGYAEGAIDAESYIGSISVRNLVYRVVPLPPSMRQLVWDFGQLSDQNEKKYIDQMVKKLISDIGVDSDDTQQSSVSDVISKVQKFMRKQDEECKYVSLRDVVRCIQVYKWLHIKYDLYELMESTSKFSHHKRTLLLAITICYYMSVDDKESFMENLAPSLGKDITVKDCKEEILAFQNVFVENLKMEAHITCNEALRENIFMMAICISLKIPLFIIGKPGSSKSLAKSILGKNMTGAESTHKLWCKLNQVHLISFQCSELTDASGIQQVFSRCKSLQKTNPDNYTAVVVLDEIGLAEASSNMPLKVLHPLLEPERGITETSKEDVKVGFLGISNWALDPSKMNRGIFVKRNIPTKRDLQETAKHIFQSSLRNTSNTVEEQESGEDSDEQHNIKVLESLTDAYEEICEDSQKDFFGLRDFYTLIKMVSSRTKTRKIDKNVVANAIIRNFSGGNDVKVQSVFSSHLKKIWPHFSLVPRNQTVCNLIKENLNDENSRFLLLLTQHLSSVWMLHTLVPDFQIIFGSEFPGDQSTQSVYRDIRNIKGCMETGKKVILLNQSRIHESLYDVLNQHFLRYQNQQYIDIGIGEERVKCRVSKDFRIIILEEESTALQKYPIPLLNRMEKHRFTAKSMYLTGGENEKFERSLLDFLKHFSSADGQTWSIPDTFVGYQDDTLASITHLNECRDLEKCKQTLLQFATMDAIVRLSLSESEELKSLQDMYFHQQQHDTLAQFLQALMDEDCHNSTYYEVVTFDDMLSEEDRSTLELKLRLERNSIVLINLLEFSKQEQMVSRFSDFFRAEEAKKSMRILLIQCQHTKDVVKLIECAKICLLDIIEKQLPAVHRGMTQIAFLLFCERHTHGSGGMKLQPSGHSEIIYIDEVKPSSRDSLKPSCIRGKSLPEVIKDTVSWEDIQNCISSVVAMVSNHRRGLERSSDLAGIFPSLLQRDHETCESFFSLLIQRIALMKDYIPDHQNWMSSQALSKNDLFQGGSFTRSLQLNLEKCLVPAMTSIIEDVDLNRNLQLLSSNEKWKADLWIQLFIRFYKSKDESLCRDFVSSTPSYFVAEFPFSFWIASRLEQYHYVSDNEQVIEKFRNFFEQSFLCLKKANVHGKTIDELIKAFMHDIIKIRYIADISSKELEVIEGVILVLAERETGRRSAGNLIELIPWIFCILEQNLEIFKQLSVIGRILPEILPKMLEIVERTEFSNLDGLVPTAFKVLLSAIGEEKGGLLYDQAVSSLVKWTMCMKEAMNLDGVLHLPDFQEETGESTEESSDISSDEEDSQNEDFALDVKLDSSFTKKQIKNWKSFVFRYRFLHELVPNNEKEYFEAIGLEALHVREVHKAFSSDSKSFLPKLLKNLDECCDIISAKVKISWSGNIKCQNCTRIMKNPIKLTPCEHLVCDKCRKENCSTSCHCGEEVSEGIEISVSQDQTEVIESFKSRCTSFFLNTLDRCLKTSNTGDAGALAEMILRGLVLREKNAELSPDASAINTGIASRRCMLMILVKHGLNEVLERVIDTFLVQSFTSTDESDIINGILHHFEHETIQSMAGARSSEWLAVLREANNHLSKNPQPVTTETLRYIARKRSSLQYVVRNLENADIIDNDLIQYTKTVCGDACTREYVTKAGLHLQGIDWLCKVARNSTLKGIVSEWLIPGDTDHWICVDGYLEARQKVSSNVGIPYPRVRVTRVPNVLVNLHWLKTHSSEMPILSLSSDEFNILNLWKILTEVDLPPREMDNIYQLIGSMIASITCQRFLNGHLRLATAPAQSAHLFFPGMPDSKAFLASRLLSDEFSIWMCPKGHLYTIGDCTQPYVVAVCPDCKLQIGGRYHEPVEGNVKLNPPTEKDQAGYYIATDRLKTINNRMPQQMEAILHFILHAALLLGLCNGGDVARILMRHQQRAEGLAPHKHLVEQLLLNLDDLSKTLSKNRDETIVLLHRLFIDIATSEQSQPLSWGDLAGRNAWEQVFYSKFLKSRFENLENILIEERRKMAEITGRQEKHLYDALPLQETEESGSWRDPKCWIFLKNTNLDQLLQKCRTMQKVTCQKCTVPGLSEDRSVDCTCPGKVLSFILERKDIYLLQYLKLVIELQALLVARYQDQIEPAEEVEFSVADLNLNEKKRIEIAEWRRLYIHAWNSLLALPNIDPVDLPPMDEKSSLAMFLPSERGDGRHAKSFCQYLVNLHNELLNTASVSTPVMDADQMSSNYFIAIDKQEDLVLLAEKYTKYETGLAQGDRYHKISYNIEELERKIIDLYVLNKRKINEASLPSIRHQQDFSIGKHWREVAAINGPQEPLDSETLREIDALIEIKALKDLCGGVMEMAVALCVLSKKKEDPMSLLQEYLVDGLRVRPDRVSVIPQSFTMKYSLATYAHLTWHKALEWVKRGMGLHLIYSPGAEVGQPDLDDTSPCGSFLEKMEASDIEILTKCLNEIVIRGIGSEEIHKNWSLAEDVLPNFVFLNPQWGADEDVLPPQFNKIPCEITVGNMMIVLTQAIKVLLEMDKAKDNVETGAVDRDLTASTPTALSDEPKEESQFGLENNQTLLQTTEEDVISAFEIPSVSSVEVSITGAAGT